MYEYTVQIYEYSKCTEFKFIASTLVPYRVITGIDRRSSSKMNDRSFNEYFLVFFVDLKNILYKFCIVTPAGGVVLRRGPRRPIRRLLGASAWVFGADTPARHSLRRPLFKMISGLRIALRRLCVILRDQRHYFAQCDILIGK